MSAVMTPVATPRAKDPLKTPRNTPKDFNMAITSKVWLLSPSGWYDTMDLVHTHTQSIPEKVQNNRVAQAAYVDGWRVTRVEMEIKYRYLLYHFWAWEMNEP